MEDLYPTRGASTRLLERRDPVIHGVGPTLNPRLGRKSRLDRFEKQGYLALSNCLPAGAAEELLAEAQRLRARAASEQPPEAFLEKASGSVRSIFGVHRTSQAFAKAARNSVVLDLVTRILGDDVYVHQSRINYKPAFVGREFFWHSDFETWHAEDGMPRMRALSLSLSLTPSEPTNGPLMVIPGSHTTFVSCPGETPADHFRRSLVEQEIGTPDPETLTLLARRNGIAAPTGPAGSAVLFDCNLLHGSNGNITPFPRTNLFVVYNAVSNRLLEPFCGRTPRPEFVGAREYTPILTVH